MPDLSNLLTQSEFGELVGISQRAVSELLSRGVIAEGGTGGTWLLEYTEHLRTVAAGRAAAGDLDLATERALLARAQRTRIERENALRAGELAPAYLIEEVLTKAGAKVASIFDGIPGAVKRRVPSLPASAVDLIRAEVAKARNIAASVSLADLDVDTGDTAADDDSETNGDND
jgi:phage terminase Nu1 subunit (DNA packaging protein)